MRERHRILREGMSETEVRKKSGRICEKLLASDWYAACDVLYAYYPLGKEPDSLPVIERALADGKTVALPRTGEGSAMEFYRITSAKQVAEGRFHVMEPLFSCPRIRAAQALVLVPGVVFDAQGGRYGYGKGYYDRYFARFPGLRRVAFAYENQMEPELDALKTDVRMERIYTEEAVFYIAGDSFVIQDAGRELSVADRI